MTKNDFQNLILVKMGMTLQDATDAGYTQYMFVLANEALNIIANDIHPNVKTIDIVWGGDYKHQTVTEDTPDYCFYTTRDGYMCKSLGDNEFKWHKEPTFVFPSDYLTSSTAPSIIDGVTITGGIRFIVNRRFQLAYVAQNQSVCYNATYPKITTTISSGEEIDIPESVLFCVATYVAAKIRRNDDPVYGATLEQEFEIMCSRLSSQFDNSILEYVSIGGWI